VSRGTGRTRSASRWPGRPCRRAPRSSRRRRSAPWHEKEVVERPCIIACCTAVPPCTVTTDVAFCQAAAVAAASVSNANAGISEARFAAASSVEVSERPTWSSTGADSRSGRSRDRADARPLRRRPRAGAARRSTRRRSTTRAAASPRSRSSSRRSRGETADAPERARHGVGDRIETTVSVETVRWRCGGRGRGRRAPSCCRSGT